MRATTKPHTLEEWAKEFSDYAALQSASLDRQTECNRIATDLRANAKLQTQLLKFIVDEHERECDAHCPNLIHGPHSALCERLTLILQVIEESGVL